MILAILLIARGLILAGDLAGEPTLRWTAPLDTQLSVVLAVPCEGALWPPCESSRIQHDIGGYCVRQARVTPEGEIGRWVCEVPVSQSLRHSVLACEVLCPPEGCVQVPPPVPSGTIVCQAGESEAAVRCDQRAKEA